MVKSLATADRKAATVTTSKTDASALLSFKSQISSDPLGVLSSWNESSQHCQWPGVSCGQHHPGRVTSLFLHSKQLTGTISRSIANLTFLRELILSDNHFHGSIPVEIGNLGRLRFLNLSLNFLEGTIPSTLAQCQKLERIKLGNNFLTGSIPSTLGNLSSLMQLYLYQNDLSGHIPDSLGNLTNLTKFYLNQNRVSGTLPFSLGNFNNIEELGLMQNMLSGFIPTSLGKLQELLFINIAFNNISGEIPHSLFNISAMIYLELGHNQLEGTLPFDMCDASSNLTYLLLYNNNLNGQIPRSISNCSALKQVELINNSFTGIIPYNIGLLENLQIFIASLNKLEAKKPEDWMFLTALANCTLLQKLDLGYNQLQGTLPSSIANLSTNLLQLGLSGNPISGSIPAKLGMLINLNTLYLSDMHLNSTIPEEIGNLIRLEKLHLWNNMLSGQIPSSFANLTRLGQLSLSNNALEGSISLEFSNIQALELLDLSNNKITGKIPKEIMGLPILNSLDLSHNYLTDSLPPEIGQLKNIQFIRLSSNKLFGEIPSTIDRCQVLQSFYLENNQLQRVIPSSLSNIKGLQELDVSNNSFQGQVPDFMDKMNLLYLNISFNNFEGELPIEGIFNNVSGIDVRGNPKLCGGVPKLHLPQCISEIPTKRHHIQQNMILIISVVGSCICLTTGSCLLVAYYSRRRSRNNLQTERSLKSELTPISYHDLVRATKNFSSENLIGRGTFRVVYKAVMNFENAINVAVKVLNLEQHGASRSFFSECEALRNVRHRNLIKVLSSCSSIDQHGNDFKALIFEFMPNGSLKAWLHPNANAYLDPPVKKLNLVQRLSIAIDVETALEYLHYHGPIPIVHCDLKPSNVLLDDEMTAHVGDFGLAKFLLPPEIMPSQSITSTGGIKGSIGYIPPEYGMGGRPSVEGDVYSFGILLLEMFTGVSPTDEKLRDGLSLHRHVELAFPEQVMYIVDTNLLSGDLEVNTFSWEKVSGCLLSVIQCGLLCSKESPKDRIRAEDVVLQLNSARKKLLSS
ncbi:hypothetical protein LUZ63_012989 [Rhynchospora breviuscula]|uniref:Receptor kinase-like protein Xa21 n=1 Tax=Rhynchospora breviuscula TaxID=2022672 RepID=A0A9Q0C802_9POAL|nr:hypothetical protein LUZ63_012989 [Rhynchospora breviuscula]